jgi:hypothetical protein
MTLTHKDFSAALGSTFTVATLSGPVELQLIEATERPRHGLPDLAADESGNMRKLVFITICATRGNSACSTWPVMPRRVAMRTGLKMQAWAIMSAASSGPAWARCCRSWSARSWACAPAAC